MLRPPQGVTAYTQATEACWWSDTYVLNLTTPGCLTRHWTRTRMISLEG
jgi:hypothetical protein